MRIWRWVTYYFVPGADNVYRPTILHRSWLLVFLSVILATEGFLVADLVARQSNQNFLAAVVPAEVEALTNGERVQNDVSAVSDNAQLDAAAQAKAADMAAKDYFSHTGPDGKTPWQWIEQFGYQYQYAGENLAVRFIDSSDVVNAWMASPTHRANIVKPVYTQIGVGVAQGLYQGQPATYVVQYFGTPLGAAAQGAAAASAPPPQAANAPASASAPAQVEGASVAAAPVLPSVSQDNSFVQSLVREITKALAEPKDLSNWILGFVALLLIIALAITFFVHVQIQSGRGLMGGVLVAGLALSFLILNSHLAEGGASPAATQTASVAQSAVAGGATTLDPAAASTGYSLFPPL